jgi:hypothetical protein
MTQLDVPLLRARMAPLVMQFGLLLLAKSKGDSVTMGDIIKCAGDYVKDSPQNAALLLACLSALDMENMTESVRVPPQPSVN